MGVVEHTFRVADGTHRGSDWKIYDVGGSRNQRQAWAPYFEDGKWPRIKRLAANRLSFFSERCDLPCPYIRI
jgi:hypothetical protein